MCALFAILLKVTTVIRRARENKESDDSTELFDDESLTMEEIDRGVLTSEHGCMAQRHDEGVEHNTSCISWPCDDIQDIASAGVRNHRSS